MTTSVFTIISYVLISSFTPGPSNISSASMAVIHGYKKTIYFQTGLAAGVFVWMVLSGVFSTTLLNIFPSIEPSLRYFGAGYILYLAFGILKASYSFTQAELKPVGLVSGFMLQILNPKLTVYALTLFTAFLAPITTNMIILIFASLLLAVTSFCATSLWALFGTAIQTYLQNSLLKIVVNILLALSLVYTAVALIGPL